MFRILALIRRFFMLIGFFVNGGVWFARKAGVTVGEGCRIYITNWGSEPFLIKIGNKVTITSGVKILTHDGSTWLVHDDNGNRYQKYSPVEIGDNVFVGVNSIVMPGVRIGSRVVVGAGSVVTKDIPDNSVAVGNPARVIADFDDFENKIMTSCVNNSETEHVSEYKKRVFLTMKLEKEKAEPRDA